MVVKACYFLICIFTIKGCSDNMKLQKDVPFDIESAIYQTIISGVRGGGSYTKIDLKIIKLNSTSINGIYYKNSYTKLINQKNNFSAQIKDTLNTQELLPGDERSRPKVNDVPDSSSLKFDLPLKKDEAILHYTENGREKYYKLKLTEKDFERDNIPM